MSQSEQVSSTIAEAGSTTETRSVDTDAAMKDTTTNESIMDQPDGSAALQPPVKDEPKGAMPEMMIFDRPTTEQEAILSSRSLQLPLQNRNTSSIHDILNADSSGGSGSNTPIQAPPIAPATSAPTMATTPPVGQAITNATATGEAIRPQGAHVREYLNENITPFLVDGMKRLARERPEKPLEWLGRYLIEQSDKNQSDTKPAAAAM